MLWEAFPAASSSLMEERALDCRSDTKFILPESLLPQLAAGLSGRYAALAAPDLYQTLYYDTPALELFHDHRRGRRVRHKVRLRAHPERNRFFLEIKTRKSPLVTVKTRLSRPSGCAALSDADQVYIRAHTGLTDPVTAQVRNQYRRMTLIGLQDNERVTVDVNLGFSLADVPIAGAPARSLEGLAIVEVKQWPFSRHSHAMAALRSLGVRPGWASKYCIGILFTRNGQTCNRLLPGMRALEAFGP